MPIRQDSPAQSSAESCVRPIEHLGPMEVFRDPAEYRRAGHRGPVWVTLGTFDGLHLGHQHLVRELVERARATPPLDADDPATRAQALVITFEVHPHAVLASDTPRPLTTIDHKLRLLGELGVDAALVIQFDEEIAAIDAERFIRDWLVRDLAVTMPGGGVLLGYNNRFGRGGRGDFALLARDALELGFTAVHGAPLLMDSGEPISSSSVRHAIEAGELEFAAKLLGRPFSVQGVVVHGAPRGREIGFPTANLDLGAEIMPPNGVYGVRVRSGFAITANGARETRPLPRWSPALCNIGLRPTVADSTPALTIEVHVLDYSGDLYGDEIELEFLTRLREERRFVSLGQLREQIADDEVVFREWLDRHTLRR